MNGEYLECQLNAEMDDVESLFFDDHSVAIYTNKKPLPLTVNEDSIGIFHLEGGHVVAAVADGMGGHKGAGQASAIVIETISEHLQGFSGSEYDLRGTLIDAIELGQLKVRDLKINAGTTLTMATLSEVGVRIYNIGDSATFHVDKVGKVKYRSYEHSVGGMQFVTGRIAEDQVGEVDDHHMLINFIGFQQLKIEVSSLRDWDSTDTLVLGSDGLFDNIARAEVCDVVSKQELDVDQQLSLIVEMAKANMEHGIMRRAKPDDLSAILVTGRVAQ